MKILLATLHDIATIQQLAEKSWKSAYQDILTLEQMDYMLSKFYSTEELKKQIEEQSNYHYFLLLDKGENLGVLGFEFHFENKTTKLHRLYLLPHTKGKGYGKEALDFLKKQCLHNDNQRIILNVNKYNNAKKFYEHQGFKTYDEGIFDIGNDFVMDDYLMEWSII